MHPISQARFDAMVTYARKPGYRLLMQELAWFEEGGEQILGTLVVDTDGEFSGIILGRDLDERFRWIGQTQFKERPEDAVIELALAMRRFMANLADHREQGDETGSPVDFFTPVVKSQRLGPGFRAIIEDPGFSPAHGVIAEMMRWYHDVDGNFIEQFQSTGFDARIWELYLFAALTEAGFSVTHPNPAPDLLCVNPLGEFLVEATTVNPTVAKGQVVNPPRPTTDEELGFYARHFLPTKYAGPLTSKLNKKYWTKDVVRGKPLVFAIQDFHDVMAMTRSRVGLSTYLYGYVHEVGKAPAKIHEHLRPGRPPISSGFFMLPGAENVSAVLFNASATLSKFNRIGLAAGFGNGRVVLIRQGEAYDPDPEAKTPKSYATVVHAGADETWIEGLEVFHNPYALHPFNRDFLPEAIHHQLLNSGEVRSTFKGTWAPMSSITSVINL